MDDTELIKLIKHSLSAMAFNDILKASNGGSKMGAFILASCFIDYLAGFYAGRSSSDEVFKDFVWKFMKSYDKERLYKDLRNRLVHNYSEGGSYVFTDKEKAGKHLNKMSDGRLLINLENFIEDIRQAMNSYFNCLDTDPELQKKAIERYHKSAILGERGKYVQVVVNSHNF